MEMAHTLIQVIILVAIDQIFKTDNNSSSLYCGYYNNFGKYTRQQIKLCEWTTLILPVSSTVVQKKYIILIYICLF